MDLYVPDFPKILFSTINILLLLSSNHPILENFLLKEHQSYVKSILTNINQKLSLTYIDNMSLDNFE